MAAINYDDERFAEVEEQKQEALTKNEEMYGSMIEQSDKFYQDQVNESKEWADKQTQLQQEQTDFAIEQIEQQKEKAQKDYVKEQKAAYSDYQKESNKYGANAEQMAAAGLAGTGYSESSRVSMYNTYQNRVATAKASLDNMTLEFNNSIKEARLQNNSALAEIAYTTYQQQLQLLLEGFQYKNSLLEQQSNKQLEIDNMYYGRYQDVVNQINTENALAEQQRQYNESLALQKAQLAEEQRQYNASLALQREQFEYEKAQKENQPKIEAGSNSYLKNVVQKLKTLEAPKAQLNYLKTLYKNGKITEEELNDLLDLIGA